MRSSTSKRPNRNWAPWSVSERSTRPSVAPLVEGLEVRCVLSSIHLVPHTLNIIDNGLTLTMQGELAGLGNGDVKITLSATGNPTATLTNPSGQNQPPGQNPAPVTLTGVISIPASEIKNGRVAFSVTTDKPVTPIPGAPDAPNPNWTEDITDVAFTSATLSVEQFGSTTVIGPITFFLPTSDGTVPGSNYKTPKT